ncbi:strawberry notch-like NTP hydrolase domain-containing protein [Flectobacillus roseus]|uniref:Strawberry notch family protein n=1 Tax=Flectobacillus roseus TaxID=502259 RepID=A0ABT6YG90_9BACT|nr:strawberry notch family protein [Flectobacillus roseus]MDI9862610.1 strawberry notch family protein [Flectobacillus roseus]
MKKTKKSLMGIALGMKYPVLSQGQSLDVDTPDSMGYEIHQALQQLKIAIGGDVDLFVQDRLKFRSRDALYKALSAEQIDASALAIYNIEAKKQGIIIADQTGIGKGRIAASMIRYATKQGYKPVFITEKPNLFSDLYRDMADIGSDTLTPFIVNARDTKTQIKDRNGDLLYAPPMKSEQDRIIKSGILPKEYDLVMLTYSQISDSKGSPKIEFLTSVAKGSILILDEAHNASGVSNTGQILMNACAQAKGVTFLSATFAKRPDNMPLYAMKTCISEAAIDTEALVNAFKQGGVALQEVVASQLASQGQLIRRERLYEGIEVNYINLETNALRDRKVADEFTDIVRDIILFQKEYIIPEVQQLDREIRDIQAQAIIENGTKRAGVDTSPAFSKVFMLVNQMLFALKADDVANRAILRLKEGKKPVIAFSSTMGSFLENMEDEEGIMVSDGSTISASFSTVLLKTLNSVLAYTIKDEVGKHHKNAFDIEAMSISARDEFYRISNKIQTASSSLCISPIDYIKQKIEAYGYRVAEVTGRKLEVNLTLNFKNSALNGLGERISETIPQNFVGVINKRKAENVNDAFRKFNDNDIDVLMINQSGSTGASAHAITTSKVPAEKVKQRVMIVLQAELDINTEVQKRGRINRTGQIKKPIYDYLISSIPAEKRLMMMLQKKLKSLDANTTANQKNSESLMRSEDFLNKYGDEIVFKYMEENVDLCLQLDDPLKLFENGKDPIQMGAASKVSGRVAVLPVLEQEKFYAEILERYHEHIKQLIEDDKFDLEVETQDLRARTLERTIVQVGAGGRSPFSDNTFIERCEVNVLRKPMSTSELHEELKVALNGKRPEQITREIIQQAEYSFAQNLKRDIGKIENTFALKRERITFEKAYQEKVDNGFLEELDSYVQNRLVELDETEANAIKDKEAKSANELSYVKNIISFFQVGMPLYFPENNFEAGGVNRVLATCLGIRINPTKDRPFAPSNIGLRIAVASSRRLLSFPSISGNNAERIFAIKGASQAIPPNYSFVKELLPKWETAIANNSKDSSIRYIVTGNLIQAYRNDNFSGRLVQFTTSENKVRKGILLPENYIQKVSKTSSQKVSVPINKCLKVVSSITSTYQSLQCSNTLAIFRKDPYHFKLVVSASKQLAGNVYLDEEILASVVGNTFEKVSATMTALVHVSNLSKVLNTLGVKLKVSAELSPEQFKVIADELNLENQFSDEIKDLPVAIPSLEINTPSITDLESKKKVLALKYKYKLRLQTQLLASA